jgi:hypothetical protein
MQLIPKTFVEAIGLNFMHNVISVFVSLPPIPEVTFLPNNLETGVAGCVHVQGTAQVKGFILCRVKVAVLGKHYVNVGLIPNDQIGFLARIREIIEEQKALPTSSAVYKCPCGNEQSAGRSRRRARF